MFALTLLRYVDKGLIDLDADISGIVPEFVRKGPLTFPALLSHTAGYNLHGFPGYRADHEPLSLEDVLNDKGNSRSSEGFVLMASSTSIPAAASLWPSLHLHA